MLSIPVSNFSFTVEEKSSSEVARAAKIALTSESASTSISPVAVMPALPETLVVVLSFKMPTAAARDAETPAIGAADASPTAVICERVRERKLTSAPEIATSSVMFTFA